MSWNPDFKAAILKDKQICMENSNTRINQEEMMIKMNPFTKLIDYILPKKCIFCNTPVYTGLPYCEQCSSVIPFAENVCPVCAKNPCICYENHFAFSAVSAVFFYESGAENAIRQLKFHEHVGYAAPLAQYLYYKLIHSDFYPYIDLIIPVPMTKKSEYQRGYNQSMLLAKELSKLVKLPTYSNILIKKKQTQKQHNLGREERQKNLKGAFSVAIPSAVTGKSILLCDDVYTTGATFHECAQTLLVSGAKAVFCLAAATTRMNNVQSDIADVPQCEK